MPPCKWEAARNKRPRKGSEHALGALFQQKFARRGNAQAVNLTAKLRVEIALVEGEQPIGPCRQSGDDDWPIFCLGEDERLVECQAGPDEAQARHDFNFPRNRGRRAHLWQIAAGFIVAIVGTDNSQPWAAASVIRKRDAPLLEPEAASKTLVSRKSLIFY